MPTPLRAALALAAALAFSASAYGAGNEPSEQASKPEVQGAVTNQSASATASESSDVRPGSSSENIPTLTAAALVEDPLATALKVRLAELTASARGHDKAEQAAIVAFYEARSHRPLWTDASGLSKSGQAIVAEIRGADAWGLDPSEFDLPTLASGATPEQLADAEVRLGLAALKYARFARGGRLDPASLTRYLDRKPPLLEPQAVLEAIAAADSPDSYLRDLHPKHRQFELLRQKYLAMRQASPVVTEAPRIPNGPKLKPGDRHAHIALVRQRLGLKFDGPPEDETLYDEALIEAVKQFQDARDFKRANGIIDASTRQALNGIEKGSPRRILANMEQWRWMPEDLGNYYIWVNVPEFMIRVVQNGKVVHSERIVVGKTDTQTPIFSDTLEQVIFHPFWGVPDSIKRNELQPYLVNGSPILARQGLRVQYGGRDIDPESVDWAAIDMRTVHIYQPPGAGNVLGVVKFRFPNKHDVYFHDTPQKHLFSASVRTFSHGCMRVQNPVRLAELILSHDKNMSSDRVRSLAAHGAPQNNQINLTNEIPVHITYFTASVDEDGTAHFRNDIYGHEERISLGLEGKAHLIAKVREPRPPAPVQAAPRYASKPGDVPAWVRKIFSF